MKSEQRDFGKPGSFTVRVLAALVFVGVLAYVAGFSPRQSIVLASLLLVVQYAGHQSRNEPVSSTEQAAYTFTPFHVRINPKWQQILMDFKVIAASEDWDLLKKQVCEALPYGICYTVLQPPEDGERGMIFGNDRNEFFSDAAFRETIRPIAFEDAPYKLRLFMTPTPDGYELGIIVPEKWWTRIKGMSASPIRERSGEAFYETELTLAALPNAEFDWYRQPVFPNAEDDDDEDSIRYEEWSRRITTRRDEQRTKYGWSVGEFDKGPTRWIEHKYFEVCYSRI